MDNFKNREMQRGEEENRGCFGLETRSSRSKLLLVGTILSSVNVVAGLMMLPTLWTHASGIGAETRLCPLAFLYSFVEFLVSIYVTLARPRKIKLQWRGYDQLSESVYALWLVMKI